MKNNIYIYILIMAGVSYLIRVTPLTLIRKQIKSRFLQSFLYYVPYVTLSVMTFPAIITVDAPIEIPVRIIFTSGPNRLTTKSTQSRQSLCSLMPKVMVRPPLFPLHR